MDNQRMDSPLRGTRAVEDLLIVAAVSLAVFLIASYINILEKFAILSQRYEYLQLDEIIVVLVSLALAMTVFSVRRVRELKQEIVERKRVEEALQRNEEWFRILIENA